jgi:hypothetical protein
MTSDDQWLGQALEELASIFHRVAGLAHPAVLAGVEG